MEILFATLVSLVLLPGFDTDERVKQLLASWAEMCSDTNALVVDFSLVADRSSPFEGPKEYRGKFRLIRKASGQVLASYELEKTNVKESSSRTSGLLIDSVLYLIDEKTRTATRYDVGSRELSGFLTRFWNPFVPLIDPEQALAKYHLKVTKQDEWYTYLAVKPRSRRSTFWFPDTFQEGRLAVLRKSTNAVPQGVPRELWYLSSNEQYTFTIHHWERNGEQAPKEEEFVRPEERQGWKVLSSGKVGAD